MKRVGCLWLVFILAASLSSAVFASSLETFSTGKDWEEKMSEQEKVISLIPPTILFRRYGVPLRFSMDKYIPALDEILVNNPYLGKEDVVNIFASTVYAYEPESREALDWMAYEFNRRHARFFSEKIMPHLLLSGENSAPKEEAEESTEPENS